MIDISSQLLQSVIVFGTLALLLSYTAYRLASRTNTSRHPPITETVNTTHSYQTPDDWDENTPLRWCDDCGAFNHAEYRFCRSCTGELRSSRMVPPQSVSRLKNEAKTDRN